MRWRWRGGAAADGRLVDGGAAKGGAASDRARRSAVARGVERDLQGAGRAGKSLPCRRVVGLGGGRWRPGRSRPRSQVMPLGSGRWRPGRSRPRRRVMPLGRGRLNAGRSRARRRVVPLGRGRRARAAGVGVARTGEVRPWVRMHGRRQAAETTVWPRHVAVSAQRTKGTMLRTSGVVDAEDQHRRPSRSTRMTRGAGALHDHRRGGTHAFHVKRRRCAARPGRPGRRSFAPPRTDRAGRTVRLGRRSATTCRRRREPGDARRRGTVVVGDVRPWPTVGPSAVAARPMDLRSSRTRETRGVEAIAPRCPSGPGGERRST